MTITGRSSVFSTAALAGADRAGVTRLAVWARRNSSRSDLLQLDHQDGGARRLIALDPYARHDGRLREIDDDPRPAGREQAIPIGGDHTLALLAVLGREMKGDFGQVDDDAVRAFHQLGVGLDRLRQGDAKLREFAFDFGRHRGRHDAGSRLGETSGPVLSAQISSSRGGERR